MGGDRISNSRRTNSFRDHGTRRIWIFDGNAVWDSYDLETLPLEPSVALDIGRDAPGVFMHLSIDLDD